MKYILGKCPTKANNLLWKMCRVFNMSFWKKTNNTKFGLLYLFQFDTKSRFQNSLPSPQNLRKKLFRNSNVCLHTDLLFWQAQLKSYRVCNNNGNLYKGTIKKKFGGQFQLKFEDDNIFLPFERRFWIMSFF